MSFSKSRTPLSSSTNNDNNSSAGSRPGSGSGSGSGSGGNPFAHPLGADHSQRRYVPYTPRQRPAPPNQGTYPPPVAHSHTNVLLQQHQQRQQHLENLKSAAKEGGVDPSSVGWGMLESIVNNHDGGGVWMDVWNAITIWKATLLLPSESQDQFKITPELVKDHIVFIETSHTSKDLHVISLSGLRGVLREDTLTFRSTLHPASKLHQTIVHPYSRPSGFSHLPPLPQHGTSRNPTVPGDPPVPYPSFSILNSNQRDTLPIPTYQTPTTATHQTHTKPPLPPRPSSRSNPTVPNPNATLPPPPRSSSPPRLHISNPFASLFGGGGASHRPSSSASSPAAHIAALPPEELLTTPVPFLLLDRTIVRTTLGREINEGVINEIAQALTSRGAMSVDEEEGFDIPEWVLERVNEFLVRRGMYPFVRGHPVHPAKDGKDGKDGKESKEPSLARKLDVAIAGRGSLKHWQPEHGDGGAEGEDYAVSRTMESPEKMEVAVQDFYAELEREVRVRQRRVEERRRERELREEEKKEDQEKDREEAETDRLVKRVVEAVESVLCSLFYDRLFMQPDSDDASHDETLASRVTALNVLDLTLEHLDIDVGEVAEELELVVRACGETLMQLEACYSPADKAAVLVGAHKVVVDGLSKLPPIRLIPEEESRANRARQHAQAQQIQQVPKHPFGAEMKEMPPRGDKVSDDTSTPVEAEVADSRATAEGEGSAEEGKDAKETNVMANEDETDEATGKATKKPPPPLDLPLASPSLPPSQQNPETTEMKDNSGSDANAKSTRTAVSGDVLLPILIFSVVKSNPPHLVSHLLFTQRFRNQIVVDSNSRGEEGYCLVNLMAVAEFLEHVDLEALGLVKEGDRPLPSAAELTPIPIVRSPAVAASPAHKEQGKDVGLGSLRGRVEQQVDAIAGSANKVLTGVVDTSFGMLKSLLPVGHSTPAPVATSINARSSSVTVTIDHAHSQLHPQTAPLISSVNNPGTTSSSPSSGTPWNVMKPGFGLLKREAGFSIAGIAASLPIGRPKSGEDDGQQGQQMITVSRPASLLYDDTEQGGTFSGVDDEEGDNEDVETRYQRDGEEGEGNGEDEEDASLHQFDDRSMKSIRSFESMMSERKTRRRNPSSRLASGNDVSTSGPGSPAGGTKGLPRKSLSDRLARMSALAGVKDSPPASSHTSLMPSVNALGISNIPSSSFSRPTTPQGGPLVRVAPPVQRFMECTPDDLRISEVGELLQEYRRLAEAIRLAGGFSSDA